MKTITEPERKTIIRDECDVLVAGAGTAGCAAAIAAARCGAKTILIEQLPLPCGTMTNGGLIFNSFYSTYTEESPTPKRIVRGIAQEIVDRMIEAGGCPGFTKIDERKNRWHRPYIVVMDSQIYMAVIGRMLKEAGVKLYLHTFLSDAVVNDKLVEAVIIQSKSGREAIKAKNFVDCTGDGDLAALSGAETFLIHKDYCWQNVGKIFSIANVNINQFMDFAEKEGMLGDIAHGKKYSSLDDYIRIEVSLQQSKSLGEKAAKEGFYGMLILTIHENHIDYFNFLGEDGVDVTNIEEFSSIELEMHEKSFKFYNFVKENVPGFSNSVFCHSANQLGIRASRIVRCDYSVANDDVVYSKRFDDEIGLYGFHDFVADPKICTMHKNGYYGLPYKMMLVKDLKNLFAAGRMVTENPHAHMSTRNTVSCMIQGQAAGTAAALCSKQNVLARELDYKILHTTLNETGVLFEPED